jgi:hypothetical protein
MEHNAYGCMGSCAAQCMHGWRLGIGQAVCCWLLACCGGVGVRVVCLCVGWICAKLCSVIGNKGVWVHGPYAVHVCGIRAP